MPFPLQSIDNRADYKIMAGSVSYLMNLPASKRVEVITRSTDPKELTRMLPNQDFYLTVKELGPVASLPLLEFASHNQLTFLFDMEWWHSYTINIEKVYEWLEFIRKQAPRQLLLWLSHVDIELLLTLLKKWLVLKEIPPDTDYLEASDELPPHTLDDIFYWNTHDEKQLPLLKTILSSLFEMDEARYFQILESVIWALPSEIEENALKLRKGRLEDQAIPDFYDALEIYRALDVEDFNKEYIDKGSPVLKIPDLSAPSYPMVVASKNELLAKALDTINNPNLEDFFKIEIASLANKIIIADRYSLSEQTSFMDAISKGVAYIQLGLDILGCRTIGEISAIVKTHSLESLFRLGFTPVRSLKIQVQKFLKEGWISNWNHGIKILPPEFKELVTWILEVKPQCVRGLMQGNGQVGDFSSLEDIVWTRDKLDLMETWGDLYYGLSINYRVVRNLLWKYGQPGEMEDITIDHLMLTAVANILLQNNCLYLPIPKGKIPNVLRKFKKYNQEDILNAFENRFRFSSEKSRKMNLIYLQGIISYFKSSISDLSDIDNIFPGYVEGLLIGGKSAN